MPTSASSPAACGRVSSVDQKRAVRIDAIVLAAGESRRMGFPKPLLRIGDETFLEHTLRLIRPSVHRIAVVLGAHADRIRDVVLTSPGVAVVENPDYVQGQLSSLKRGLREVAPSADAVMVHLADHPLVNANTFRTLAETYQRTRAAIVIARYNGRGGHPVIFDRSVFPELLAASLADGARAIVNAVPSRIVYSDVDDPGVALDLDTPDDLARAGLPPPPR